MSSAIMAMILAGQVDMLGLLGDTGLGRSATDEEIRFLKTLSGTPYRIWARRVARGLTPSETEYIRERLKEHVETTRDA
jgi:hypothetical protein